MQTRTTSRDGTDWGNDSFLFLMTSWIRQSWDEMGALVAGSFVFFLEAFLGFAPVLGLSYWFPDSEESFFPLVAAWVTLLFLGVWWSFAAWLSLNRFLEQRLGSKDPSWLGLTTGIPSQLKPAFLTTVLLAVVGGLLLFNWKVYPLMFENWPFLRIAALVLTGWMILMLALVQVHLIPFLVHQDRSFATSLKRSTLIALARPLRTLAILFFQVSFLLFSFMPPLGFLLPGLYATLSNLSLLILLGDWQDPYEKTPEAIRAGV